VLLPPLLLLGQRTTKSAATSFTGEH